MTDITDSRQHDLVDVSAEEHVRIQRFLFREAQLLDERQFDAWLALFDDDVDYIIVYPTSPSATSSPDDRPAQDFLDQEHVPLTVLTKPTMTLRVRRLQSGRALDDEPHPPTIRLIANVDGVRLAAGRYSVRSAFVLVRDVEGQPMLTGTRRDTLVATGAAFRIVRRVVEVGTRCYPSNVIFV